MHKLIARIARLAVSKAAAFVDAVAVGVAGNLAFNFVQQHHQQAAAVAAPEPGRVGDDRKSERATVTVAVPPPLAPATPTAAAPARPLHDAAAVPPSAGLPMLPEPAAAALPRLDALPAPTLKPAALPPREEAAKPLRPAVSPLPVAAAPAASETGGAAAPAPIGVTQTAALPAVDVAPPPEPPAPLPAATTAMPPPADIVTAPAARSLELSDIWHPGRAVKRGLHWAGDQLPVIGGAEAEPQFPRAGLPPSAPIPLLPTAERALSDNTDTPAAAAKPRSPGPGSGGLY